MSDLALEEPVSVRLESKTVQRHKPHVVELKVIEGELDGRVAKIITASPDSAYFANKGSVD